MKSMHWDFHYMSSKHSMLITFVSIQYTMFQNIYNVRSLFANLDCLLLVQLITCWLQSFIFSAHFKMVSILSIFRIVSPFYNYPCMKGITDQYLNLQFCFMSDNKFIHTCGVKFRSGTINCRYYILGYILVHYDVQKWNLSIIF